MKSYSFISLGLSCGNSTISLLV